MSDHLSVATKVVHESDDHTVQTAIISGGKTIEIGGSSTTTMNLGTCSVSEVYLTLLEGDTNIQTITMTGPLESYSLVTVDNLTVATTLDETHLIEWKFDTNSTGDNDGKGVTIFVWYGLPLTFLVKNCAHPASVDVPTIMYLGGPTGAGTQYCRVTILQLPIPAGA